MSFPAGLGVCVLKRASVTAGRRAAEPLSPRHAHALRSFLSGPHCFAAARALSSEEIPQPPFRLTVAVALRAVCFHGCSGLGFPAGPQICQRRQISSSLLPSSASLGVLAVPGGGGSSTHGALPQPPAVVLLPHPPPSVHGPLGLPVNANRDTNKHGSWKMTPASDNCRLHRSYRDPANTSDT